MSLCINPQCPKPDNSDTILFCEACGSELLLKGRYRAMCKLGEGGFGITYEVTKVGSTVPEVLKVLTYDEPKAIELFQQEAKVLSELDHPGIPKVERDSYFVYHPRGSQIPIHCFVMEKIVGMDLRQYMENLGQRPIDQKLAIDWLKELVTILGKVHDKNFFHRDIKPPNIMICSSGELVLIDFGTARKVTTTVLEQKGGVTQVVSEGYTPQEQMVGDAIPQSDFFALGRTFVALLTGKEPLDLYDSFRAEVLWRTHAPEISPLLANLIDEMMAHKPSQRPANTQVILQKLADIERKLYSSPIPPPTKPVSPPLPKKKFTPPIVKPVDIGKEFFMVLLWGLFISIVLFVPLFWGHVIFSVCSLTNGLLIGIGITMFLLFAEFLLIKNPYNDSICYPLLGLFVAPPFISFIALCTSPWHFSNFYSPRSLTDNLLAFSIASIACGSLFGFCQQTLLHTETSEGKYRKFLVKHSFIESNKDYIFPMIGSLSCLFGNLVIFATIIVFHFTFLSASEYIIVAGEFFAAQAVFRYWCLNHSLISEIWMFLTFTIGSLLAYYCSFIILGKLVDSDISKTIIGLVICSVMICPSITFYLIKNDLSIDDILSS